jgi:RNA polymerase sigma-70 factor (ECF subfamily)
LFEQARKGNKTAENDLFKALTVRFQVLARKRIWDKQDAEEIAQDALTAVFANYRTTEIKLSFIAWAHKTLLHKILNYYRSKGRRDKIVSTTDKLDLIGPAWEPNPLLEPKLKACLKKITTASPRYARILNYTFQGYSVDEICAAMNITAANCYTILSRSRSLLKRCLKEGDE